MGVLLNSPLVGRAAELAALRRAVVESFSGRGTTVVVRGEAGIGKTRLVGQLVSGIVDGECTTLSGSCSTSAQPEIPWRPWLDVVRALRRVCGDELVARLLGDRLPLMAPLAAGLTPLAAHHSRPSRGQLYGTVTDLLLGAAEVRPLLLVIEDVQWADEDSLALLLYLAHSARTYRLALLVTARTEVPAYERVRDRIGELTRLPGAIRLDLGPLGPDDVAIQIRHLAGKEIDSSVLTRIVDLSGGVPLYVEELVAAAARDAGTITPHPLRERLERLSPPARDVVDSLAVAAASPSPALLLRASAGAGPDFDAALAECHAAAVVVSRGGRVEFRHALLREAALSELLPHRTAELHRCWAQAWTDTAVRGDHELERAVAIAHHWRAADEPVTAFDAILRAADLARQSSAYATRFRLLKDAARLWPDVPDAEGRARRDLAGLLTEGSQAALAAFASPDTALWMLARARRALVTSETDSTDRLAWLDLLEAEYLRAREVHRSVDESMASLAAIPRDPPSREWVLAAKQTADVLLECGRPEDGERCARDAVCAARVLRDPDLESGATMALALNQVHVGRTREALRLAQAAVRLTERSGDLEASHHALNGLSVIRWYVGDLEGAREATLRDLELLGGEEPGELPRAWGLQRVNLAEACLDLGEWDEAERILTSVLQRAEMPDAVMGFALRLMRHLAAWRRGGGGDEPCGEPGSWDEVDLDDLVAIRYTAADRAAYNGDVAGVRRLLRDVVADERTALVPPLALPLLHVAARAEADQACSGAPDTDPDAGAWTTAHIRQLLTLIPTANARDRAYASHIQAELLRGDGTDDPAVWSEVVRLWRETPMPHPLTWALLRLADSACRDGQRAAATAAANEAIALGTRLRAEPVIDAAQLITRRLGLRTTSSGSSRTYQLLTAREREVLRLLAAGASNAAIAERLFISPKTAAVHVSHIMDKLGAHSRGAAVATALRLGVTSLDEAADAQANPV